jgi:hypothetical protein
MWVQYRAVELNEDDPAHNPTHVADGVVGPQHAGLIILPKEDSA